MRFEVLAPDDLTPVHVETWRRLQREAGLLSPFLSPDWARALVRSEGPDRVRCKVVVVHQDDAPAGYMAVRLRRGVASPPGAPMCDYQALVARAGLRVDPRALLQALHAGRLDFDALLEGEPNFAPFARGSSLAHVVDLKGGVEAWAAGRASGGSDFLKDGLKKRRKLEREQGPVRFVAGSASRADFDTLIAWKRARWRSTGQTDLFDAGWPLQVLEDLFQADDGAFGAKLFTLHAGGRLAAAHLALCAEGVVHAWFIAHDDRFARYSPGVLLLLDMIDWAPKAGISEIDLGPGESRFKHSFANRTRATAHGFVGRPSAASLMRAAAYRLRSVAEALPLGSVSALPGKAMRRLDVMRSLG